MISTKGRYALRMMIDIANQGEGTRTSLREVAERQGISLKYLEQLTGPLVNAGLLQSFRGPRGGYTLAMDPEKISAGEIVRIAEGGLAPIACLEDGHGLCPRRDECETVDFWAGLETAMSSYMDGVSLAQLATKESAEAAHG